ncbi:MAG: hypothetical protein KDD62_08475, partial [Bdellovibrionales bacterium]|nr:hypothetical protein [Bdellovibrionales bacterium]
MKPQVLSFFFLICFNPLIVNAECGAGKVEKTINGLPFCCEVLDENENRQEAQCVYEQSLDCNEETVGQRKQNITMNKVRRLCSGTT